MMHFLWAVLVFGLLAGLIFWLVVYFKGPPL